MNQVRSIAYTGDVCGEAATWSAAEGCIYWVDIYRFLLHAVDIDTEAVRSWEFDQPVVALSLTDRDGILLIALAFEIILFEPATGRRRAVGATLDGAPDVRFNDGRSDVNGNFWVGTMANNVGPEGQNLEPRKGLGRLLRLHGTELAAFDDGLGISNTVCWSPEGGTFYFGDTLENEIRAYDYDKDTATVSNPRPFFTGFDRGLPDGSAMDAEGYLWNCRFGGGCVVRLAPDGSIDRVIEMPVANITTCCFGGSDLATLFITTASVLKADTDRLAGCLFAVDSSTRGQAENRYRIPGGIA